jgi:hypothetical protein
MIVSSFEFNMKFPCMNAITNHTSEIIISAVVSSYRKMCTSQGTFKLTNEGFVHTQTDGNASLGPYSLSKSETQDATLVMQLLQMNVMPFVH